MRQEIASPSSAGCLAGLCQLIRNGETARGRTTNSRSGSSITTGRETFTAPSAAAKIVLMLCSPCRALYGTDGTKNAVHGSDSFASALREVNFCFKPAVSQSAAATASAELTSEGEGKEGNKGEAPTGGRGAEKGDNGACGGGIDIGGYNLDGFAAEEKTLALLKPGVSELHLGTRQGKTPSYISAAKRRVAKFLEQEAGECEPQTRYFANPIFGRYGICLAIRRPNIPGLSLTCALAWRHSRVLHNIRRRTDDILSILVYRGFTVLKATTRVSLTKPAARDRKWPYLRVKLHCSHGCATL